MEIASWVQFMDEDIYVLLYSNALENIMNPSVLT